MNEITKKYLELQKASGLNIEDFIKTITNEEDKMYIQWKFLRKYSVKF